MGCLHVAHKWLEWFRHRIIPIILWCDDAMAAMIICNTMTFREQNKGTNILHNMMTEVLYYMDLILRD